MSDPADPQTSIQGPEREILELIAKGLNINSWLIDSLGNIDGQEFQRLINRLKDDELILQKGSLYLDKVTYELSEKGRRQLPPLSEEDTAMLAEYGIDHDSIETLESVKTIDKPSVQLSDIVEKRGQDLNYQKALVEKLAEDGYVSFKGILIPKIILTEEGENIVRRFQHRQRS